ncbi:hypothetical protein [Streptomyces sp. NPDC047123]|uniref:hypothetical protein n=1 Tax=Streptomyces sp. NPDC047123 TaxID=3155622 RepID=UPI0034083317
MDAKLKLTPDMIRLKYVALTGFAAAALLLGPTTATAAGPTPPAPAPAGVAATPEAPQPSLTAQASVSSVRASEEFRISGESRELRAGTPVTLQQKQGERWVTLPATVNTTAQGTYAMRVRLQLQGRNALRTIAGNAGNAGNAISPVVYVTVRP